MKKKQNRVLIFSVCVLSAAALAATLFTSCTGNQKKAVSSSASSDTSSASSAVSEDTSSVSSAAGSAASADSASSAAASSSEASSSVNYTTYSNQRFGYSIPIPSSLHETGTANSAGQNYISSDNTVICNVAGSNNALNLSPSAYFQRFFYGRQSGILAKQESGNTTVVTWQVDGNYGYIKSVVGTGSINTVRFQFPDSKKADYDAVAQYVLAHFETPNVTETH